MICACPVPRAGGWPEHRWHVPCSVAGMRNIPGALPAADDLDSARLILRDGTSAIVRLATPDDTALMRRFFHELSRDARLVPLLLRVGA